MFARFRVGFELIRFHFVFFDGGYGEEEKNRQQAAADRKLELARPIIEALKVRDMYEEPKRGVLPSVPSMRDLCHKIGIDSKGSKLVVAQRLYHHLVGKTSSSSESELELEQESSVQEADGDSTD